MEKSELRRLKERRDTIKMSLRTLRSDIANPAILQRSIDNDKQTMEIIQSRVHANERRLDTMHAMHDKAVSELAQVNAKIKLEANSVQVRALKKLKAAMMELSPSN